MTALPSAGRCRRAASRRRRIRDRARIELPLPALEAVVARLADDLRHARRAPAPSAPSRSGQSSSVGMPPQRLRSRVRPAAASPGRARSPCRRRRGCRRARQAGRHCGGRCFAAHRCRRAGSSARSRAHSASVSARVSGQSYIGSAAMKSLMPASCMRKRSWQLASGVAVIPSAARPAPARCRGR